MKKVYSFAGAMALLAIMLVVTGCPSPNTQQEINANDEDNNSKPVVDLTYGGVKINGKVELGETLTASLIELPLGRSAINYQWLRNGVAIEGARGNEYTLSPQDISSRISVNAKSGDVNYTSTPTLPLSNPFAPTLPGSVTLAGIAQSGRVLQANISAVGGSGEFFYEWKLGGVVLNDAIGPSFQVPADSAGKELVLSVSRSGNSGFLSFPVTIMAGDGGASNAALILDQKMETATYTVGQSAKTLSVSARGANLTYQWFYRNNLNTASPPHLIKGQTGNSYTPSTLVPINFEYYVEVTNTEPGNKPTRLLSESAFIIVNGNVTPGDVKSSEPEILSDLAKQSTSYQNFSVMKPLSIDVRSTGDLSYQWEYSDNGGKSYVPMKDAAATTSSIKPWPILTNGETEETRHYRVRVSNQDYGKNATNWKYSTVAAITIYSHILDKEISALPEIGTHPVGRSYEQGATATPLTVTATGSGQLLYQWYRVDPSAFSDVPLDKQNKSSFTPPTDIVGTFRYYVSVTNLENGKTPSTLKSNAAVITVNAKAPQVSQPATISKQPAGATYEQNKSAAALEVTAQGTGSLFYQWYKSDTQSGTGAAINGATATSYTPSTLTVGTAYYYVNVTNVETGNIPAVLKSNVVAIVVTTAALPPPPPPEAGNSSAAQIRKNLSDITIQQSSPAQPLVIDAIGGKLSFQWFQAPSKTGAGTKINGSIGESYVPRTDTVGKFYYYVEITNVDWWPEGLAPTTVKSNVAEVNVTERGSGGSENNNDPALVKILEDLKNNLNTKPEVVAARLKDYLPKKGFEELFPLRIGSEGWKQYMRDNYGHAAFPNWQDYDEYYSYNNLVEAVKEISKWGYILETRNLAGGLTNYNSRGYIVEKATGKTYPVFEEGGFNASWNQNAEIIRTVVDYGSFLTSSNATDNKRELAALLANMAHETGAGWEGAPGGEERWGFFFNEEVAVVTSGGYSDSYTSQESVDYPPVPGKSYHGRGGIQLSWNYNYGPFSILAFGDKNVLLQNPERVAKEGKLGWMSGIWFWMTPQLPKASCHDVIQSTWKPEGIFASGKAKGIVWGFGATINIINGGFEAGGRQKQRRINHYKDLLKQTGIQSTGSEKLDTVGMSPWT